MGGVTGSHSGVVSEGTRGKPWSSMQHMGREDRGSASQHCPTSSFELDSKGVR
jgi:hypothetical protein